MIEAVARLGRRAPAAVAVLGAALVGMSTLGSTLATATGAAFPPGTAMASSQSVTMGPQTAGLDYSVTFGTVNALYVDHEGRAQAQSIKLGLLGLLLTTGSCGRPPALAALPTAAQPVIADSRSGADRHSQDEAPLPSPLTGLGTIGNETADAGPGARSAARTTTSTIDAVVASVSGVESDASTQLLADARDALAVATVSRVSLGGGLVELRDLRWTAHRRSGRGGVAEAGFSAGSMVVGRQPMETATPASLAAAISSANTVLAPVGLQLLAPVVVRRADGSQVVTPLHIVISGGTSSGPLASTVVTQLQAARERATGLLPASCDRQMAAGGVLTPVDLLGDALAGSGSARMSLGGAQASTNDTIYANPFGAAQNLLPAVERFAAEPPVTRGTTEVTTVPPGAPGRAHVTPGHAAGALVTWCRTMHPLGRPICSSGDARLAGSAALTIALLVVMADLVHGALRRRRRPA